MKSLIRNLNNTMEETDTAAILEAIDNFLNSTDIVNKLNTDVNKNTKEVNQMITKEQFKKIESAYGCGYWHVCDDHACPCHPKAPVSQGFSEKTYESMKRQNEEYVMQLEREFADYD